MAKRKVKTTRAGGTTIVTLPAASPIQRRSRRRSSAPVRRSSGRRRRSSSGGGGFLGGRSSLGSRMIGHGVGGFAVGWIEKTFPSLPTIPLVGKKGAIALAAYFLHGKHPIITDVGLAAAAISGYELGTSGHISGDVMGGVASQM